MFQNKISEKELKDIMNNIRADKIQKIVVGAVIDMGANHFLLLERQIDDFMGGLIELPGGTVETDETLIDALIREIYEETGLHIASIDKFIGFFDYISGSGKKTRQVNFKVMPTNKDVQLSSEHIAYYICSSFDNQLNDLNISVETKQIINMAS